MSNVRFSRPWIDTSNIYDSVAIVYPFCILNEGKSTSIRLGVSDCLLLEFGRHIRRYDIPGYYDQIVVMMFPYVIDKVKQDPHVEGVLLGFSTDHRPGSVFSEWDTTESIEAINGYELEV